MTVTRISDLAQNQQLINALAQANQQEAKTELQVSTGKNAQYFKDLPDQTGVLLSTKSLLDRNASYSQTVTELQQRIGVQDASLQSLEGSAGNLAQNVMDAVSNNSGLSLMDQINAVFQQTTAALNTQVDGQYIFGGTRTDAKPFNGSSIADLVDTSTVPQSTVPIAGLFQNNDTTASAVVNDGVKIDYGYTASDLGTQLMTAIQAIKQFNDTNPDGPFGQNLTSAQASFLQGQIANLRQISTDITAQTANNGVVANQVDNVATQLANTKTQATQFVSDIEDVDLPTALTNLQQDQLALQAAARMAANIGQMSLLNFLPIT